MALIKCTECGQDISTDAKACPHCGKPNKPIAPIINQQYPKKDTWKAITGFAILGLVFVGLYFWTDGGIPPSLKQNVFKAILPQTQSQTPAQSGHNVPLQEVKNLGYDFYVGQIDNPDTNDLTDDLKNQITKIVYNAHFPETMLKNMPIIILNSLDVTGDQYISIGGKNLEVGNLTPAFLSEGGYYETYQDGSMVIFINKATLTQNGLTETLTHELGHAVGSTLTTQDWATFYQLRNIPAGTAQETSSWNLSPAEDFAEVYKYTYTGIAVRTFFGLLMPDGGYSSMMEENGMNTCGKIYIKVYRNYLQQFQTPNTCPAFDINNLYNGWDKCLGQTPTSPTTAQISQAKDVANADATVQSCRRDVLTNPSKYPSDWKYTTPYQTSVSQATKDFIQSIVDRLNK